MWHGLAAMCVTKVERCPLTINPTWVTDMTWPPEKLLPSCSAINEAWFGLAAYWLTSGSHLMTLRETDPAWTPFWIVCSPSFLKPSSLIEKPVCVIQSVIATCLWITFAVAWRDHADSGHLTDYSRAVAVQWELQRLCGMLLSDRAGFPRSCSLSVFLRRFFDDVDDL